MKLLQDRKKHIDLVVKTHTIFDIYEKFILTEILKLIQYYQEFKYFNDIPISFSQLFYVI